MKEIEITTCKPKIFDDPKYCEEEFKEIEVVKHCDKILRSKYHGPYCIIFGPLEYGEKYKLVKHQKCKQYYKASKK